MKAELISIGDELLIGTTINTNAAYLGKRLIELGIKLSWITTVGDDNADLIKALDIASHRADIIITTGGLGPTNDDLTKTSVAQYFDMELVLNEDVLHDLKDYFRRINKSMAAVNIEQAYVPENAIVFRNKVGTAPALYIERGGVKYFILPGVPHEMQYFFDTGVSPVLKELSGHYIKYEIIKTTGIGESDVFERLERLHEIDDDVRIAFLPKSSGVEIRITSTGTDENECMTRINDVKKFMYDRLSAYIWGENDDVFEDKILELLSRKVSHLAIIELFTGGLISYRLTTSRVVDERYRDVSLHGLVFVNSHDVFDWLIGDREDPDNFSAEMLWSQKTMETIRCKTGAELLLIVSELSSQPEPLDKTTALGNVMIALSSDDIHKTEQVYVRLYDLNFSREKIAQHALRLIQGVLLENRI